MCDRSTVVTSKKALFNAISLFGYRVIAYRTNLVVIVPRAFWTFHDQCPVHIGILTIFTGIFRVQLDRLFRAAIFCFLAVVFSVVVTFLGFLGFPWYPLLRSPFLLRPSLPSSSFRSEPLEGKLRMSNLQMLYFFITS